MKNFFKKLAFVLALAMVVTAIAPAAQASAAAQPTLNATSKKIYIDGDYTGKYSDTFTLKVWNKGDYRVTFASSDTKIATVTKWYGVVTAKAVGTATITATVSNKTTGKVVKTLSSKVYVKKNADSVAFGSLAKFDQPLVVGDKVKINVARKAGTVTAWKQADKTQITDYTLWTSSNPEVATVDKWGTVKAIAAGETTISAVAMQTEGKVATTAPATVKVTVVAKGITEVAQKTATKLVVTFGVAQDTDKVTKDTLLVTPADASKANPLVKSVTWSEDKKVATVELYLPLEDKVVYTVSVKDTESKKDFVASVGTVASITISNPATAVENVPTEVKTVLKDANGVEVNKANSARIDYEVVENKLNGFTFFDATDNKQKVTLFEKGKTVVLKATYYTGEFTDAGEEIKIESNAFVVSAISQKDVNFATTKFTVAKTPVTNWDNYTQKTNIALSDTGVYSLYVYAKDSTGKAYTGNTGFTFESLDESKLAVDANTGNLYPIKEGNAVVKVKHTLTEKTFLVTITIGTARKPVTFTLSDNYIVVSNSADESIVEVKGTIKDQFDDSWTLDGSADNKFDIVENNVVDAGRLVPNHTDKKLTFVAAGAPAGTYSYRVTVNGITRALTIVVKAPNSTTAATKNIALSTQSIDLAVNKDNKSGKSITVSYRNLDSNGVLISKESVGSYTIDVTNPKGKTVTNVAQHSNGKDYVITLVDSSLQKVESETGTYTVTLKVNGVIKQIQSFVVADSQKTVAVTVNKTSATSAVTGSALSVAQALDVFNVKNLNDGTVDGDNDLSQLKLTVVSAPAGSTLVAGTKDVTNANFDVPGTYVVIIQSVQVTEHFGTSTFIHTVGIGQSITITVR